MPGSNRSREEKMRLNPSAVTFWIFTGSVGYAVNGAHGAAVGLAIGTGVSYLITWLGW
jgi:hypothetical protein